MRRSVAAAFLALGVCLAAAWSLLPAAWQALTAVKPEAQITASPAVWVPSPPTTEHVRSLLERKPFDRYLANSALVSLAATLLALAAAAPAASALCRMRPRARSRWLLGLLLVSLFPPILLLFPLYEGVRLLGLVNNPLALVLPYAAFGVPLATWVLEAGFRELPKEVEEAATLDGLGPLGRLLRVQLPLAAPSVAAAGLLTFIASWNEFLLALSFTTRESSRTVTAGIASVSGASLYEVPWGPLSAAVVLATLPVVLLVLLFERRISGGLTGGAVKG
ncbi:MAG: carbohydrate ABC transporter permease [Thermoanaerobaculia bacterium]|nr:carbohydrate ABC transporter permease [Thermoanaerobaculia bacterium]